MSCIGHDHEGANIPEGSACGEHDSGEGSVAVPEEAGEGVAQAIPTTLAECVDMKKENTSIHTIELNSWSEYEDTITNLRNKYGTCTLPSSSQGESIKQNNILFRGQSNSEWPIKTTLERTSKSEYTVQEYLYLATSCTSEIESLTGKTWALEPYPDICQEIEKTQDFMRVYIPHACYGYLVYLRHHGFPSPLLDWTRSPYIAAYFAFRERWYCQKCAVFLFIETPSGFKYNSSGDVLIRTYGPYVKTHSRHFAQKAEYTTATRWNYKTNTHTFCPHQMNVNPSGVFKQDILIKITIPRKDRIAALKQLEDYNINEYTLFQSEDALVRTMGMRMFDLKERS